MKSKKCIGKISDVLFGLHNYKWDRKANFASLAAHHNFLEIIK
jgi:hypothetical protein